jgi:hypothetical protein
MFSRRELKPYIGRTHKQKVLRLATFREAKSLCLHFANSVLRRLIDNNGPRQPPLNNFDNSCSRKSC